MKNLSTVTMFGLSLALLIPSPAIASGDASKAFADIEKGVKNKKTSTASDNSQKEKQKYLDDQAKKNGTDKKK